MADVAKRMLLLGLVGFIVVSLGACREEEQGRILSLQAGKFMGENPDKPFSQQLAANLRARTIYQAGSTTPVGGGNKLKDASLDRVMLQSLRLRVWSQSGRK